jgi:hypothetical protein
MNENTLFYGNINIRQKEILESISNKFDDVASYFTAFEFIYPNNNDSFREVISINHRLKNPKSKSIMDKYKSIDKDLWGFLKKSSLNIGMNEVDYIQIEKFIKKEIAPLVVSLKDYWNRARPYQYAFIFESDFHPHPTISGHSPSYPSGHTLESEVWGFLSKKILPKKTKEINSIVEQVNESRLELGVHFPSDIEFSQEVFNYIKVNKLLL